MAHERDERWVYVALIVLALAYLIYRYGTSIEFPDVSFRSFRGLRKLASTLPYLAATFFGVFFQIWNRRKQAAARARMEEDLKREGVVRQVGGLRVDVGERRKQSFEADLFLTRLALYVFDRAQKRGPSRLPVQRVSDGTFLMDASLVQGASDLPPAVRVEVGGKGGQPFEFAPTDAVAWWMDLRSALGKTADVEAELAAAASAADESSTERMWPGDFFSAK